MLIHSYWVGKKEGMLLSPILCFQLHFLVFTSKYKNIRITKTAVQSAVRMCVCGETKLFLEIVIRNNF